MGDLGEALKLAAWLIGAACLGAGIGLGLLIAWAVAVIP